MCQCYLLSVFSSFARIGAEPEAGFQKDEPKNEWEGEDEGLDLTVSV